ncbi:hypothetical protein MSAN_01210100 [Mycena sanguinolenta]|uniref:NAD(P)-binding protein n=1 Tax=Mycena sanguinolenta TaxID=230812 RepID=A0A8H6YHB9_9AGAR|nr:hypothetical protein MSAN_01210100 [Mycena sanguinolenta]
MSSNKVILVTGSNSGIGYELVHLLAAKGHTVYLAARKQTSGIEAVAKIKGEKNLDVKFVQLDVTEIASIEAAVAKIQKDEGCIGEFSTPQTAAKPNITSIRATFETNFYGMIQTTTAFLPLLRSSSTPGAPSVILQVSSDMASNTFMASPESFLHEAVAYNTSKAAANSYIIALARELKEAGIKVNCVIPGFTTTKLNAFAPGGKTPEKGAETLLEWCLLDKDGKTGQFAYDGGVWPW